MAALEASLAAGCTFYDSAAAYGMGRSDALLGALVAAHPSANIVTAGKIPPKNLRWPASPDDAFTDVFPLDHVLTYAQQSRDRMRVAAVDLIQLHVWDDSWADDPEFHRVVAAVKDRGIARFFGISLNRWEPWNGIKAIRTGLIDAVQVIYNVFDQAPEDELFHACAERGVGVSDVRHLESGTWVDGPHPERANYESFADFTDPDGNIWILQEVDRSSADQSRVEHGSD